MVMNVNRTPIAPQPDTLVTILEPSTPVQVTRDHDAIEDKDLQHCESAHVRVATTAPLDQPHSAQVGQDDKVLLDLVQRVDEDEYKKRLLELFYEHKTAFSMNENDLGHASILRYVNNHSEGIRLRFRRRFSEHVTAMLEQGFIKPAESPYPRISSW